MGAGAGPLADVKCTLPGSIISSRAKVPYRPLDAPICGFASTSGTYLSQVAVLRRDLTKLFFKSSLARHLLRHFREYDSLNVPAEIIIMDCACGAVPVLRNLGRLVPHGKA
jgi:hypothetical protein